MKINSRAHLIGSETTAELAAQDRVIPAGHIVIPSDNAAVFKVGDGESPYSQLSFFEGVISLGGL